MKNKAFLLLLSAGFSTFLNSWSFAADYYGSTSSSSRMAAVQKVSRPISNNQPLFAKFAFSPSELSQLSSSLSYAELIAAGQTIPNYTVALAALNQNEDFFGYNPRDPKETAQFNADMQALTQQRYADHPLVCDWIEQPSSVMKLIGFLNSFGMTLANVDLEKVASVVKAQEEIDPKKCLNKAYGDMTRLISGQVVKINPNLMATSEQERIYITAASNLGYKKGLEFESSRNDEDFEMKIVNSLLAEYNLLNPLNLDRSTLRHNLILLRISYFEALNRGFHSHDVQSLQTKLAANGFDGDLLNEVEQRASSLFVQHRSIQVASSELKAILHEPAYPFYSSQNSSYSALGGSLLDDWAKDIN